MLFETADAVIGGESHKFENLEYLAKVLDNSPSVVCVVDGEQIEFSARVAQMLALILRATAEGETVTFAVDETLLSPEEAARTLGVSRPTVVRWINKGLLSDRRVGAHHRVPFAEVRALSQDRSNRAEWAKSRVATLNGRSTKPTPKEVFAAALAARDGDQTTLDRVRDDDLSARAAEAANAARRNP